MCSRAARASGVTAGAEAEKPPAGMLWSACRWCLLELVPLEAVKPAGMCLVWQLPAVPDASCGTLQKECHQPGEGCQGLP